MDSKLDKARVKPSRERCQPSGDGKPGEKGGFDEAKDTAKEALAQVKKGLADLNEQKVGAKIGKDLS